LAPTSEGLEGKGREWESGRERGKGRAGEGEKMRGEKRRENGKGGDSPMVGSHT